MVFRVSEIDAWPGPSIHIEARGGTFTESIETATMSSAVIEFESLLRSLSNREPVKASLKKYALSELDAKWG
jgi:citrate lyase synthetase